MTTMKINGNSEAVEISINGSFTFEQFKDFPALYSPFAGRQKFIVNVSQVDFIDSAALGMLIQLRIFAGENNADITIQGHHGEVKKSLEVASFSDLFTLD